MKRPKVLLLTDNFPSNNSSGGVINQQLCYYLLEENCEIYCSLIKQPRLHAETDELIINHIKKIEFKKPTENPSDHDAYLAEVKNISQKINSFITKNHIDIVWCPIQGETVLRLFSAITKKFKGRVRLVAQIWDPIEWPLHELRYSQKDIAKIIALFDKTLPRADYVLTASYPMNHSFSQKYHVACAPIFTSYRQNTYYPQPAGTSKSKDTFTILLAGQTYAQESLIKFINALQKMNWHYAGKEIYFKYYGPSYESYMQDDPHISIGGHIAQSHLIEEERQADLLYCPYYLGDHPVYHKVSTESYPSKIITYIPAETPILVHSDSSSSIYQDFKKHKCGFLLDSLDVDDIIAKLQQIITTPQKQNAELIQNANQLFNKNFTRERNKKVFLKALGIPYHYDKPSYRILEVNNLDLPGKRWNGYDLAEYINEHTHHLASQIVTYKTSHSNNVTKIFTPEEQQLEYKLLDFEANQLSVHSCLSCSSPILLQKNVFNNADIIHLHLIHNMKLSLISLIEICNKKPTIITIHDPWTFTGRCVWLYDCQKYLTGCHNCPNLNNLFPLKCDNCHELWNLKKLVYDKLDVDYVVTTKYMYDLFQNSPLTKGKRVHIIPFGIDTNEFYQKVSQEEAKKHYHIPDDHIVIFHRAQFLSKGTEYVIEALKELNTDRKITVITCSEKGRLNSVKHKFNIIDLGDINSEELTYAYNACDIFLSPSIGESFCMMAVEAMSCAKPIIVFDNTALPSVTFTPDCGVLVEDRNSHKLMEAIKWLVEDQPERLRRGALARKLACKHYDLNTYNQKIEKLYEEIATRKHHYTDYDTLLSQKPQDTTSALALKSKLNLLTRQIFPKYSPQYRAMFFNLKKPIKKSKHKIKYGDLNTQLLINQYNNDLIKNVEAFDPYKLYGPLHIKLLHKARTLTNLLLHDRQNIKNVIHKKIDLKRKS